jgi:hypothetical protein
MFKTDVSDALIYGFRRHTNLFKAVFTYFRRFFAIFVIFRRFYFIGDFLERVGGTTFFAERVGGYLNSHRRPTMVTTDVADAIIIQVLSYCKTTVTYPNKIS